MRSTEEKIKRKVISVVIIVAILSTVAGCGKSQSRKEPITLTIWHVYGGQTDSPLNDLIDEFNGTEGKKEGIKIQVGMVSNTNTIHEEVLKAANKDPGAAKLPDLFISYPKTVLAMNDSGILADYHDYFSENELTVASSYFRLLNRQKSYLLTRRYLIVFQQIPELLWNSLPLGKIFLTCQIPIMNGQMLRLLM